MAEYNYLQYTQTIITAVDEFDFKEIIKPSAIMEYFQDLATVHATEIGIGFETMKSENLCWVLNRLSAVIDKSPNLGEEIIITTYPHKPGLVDAVRDYYITDKSGNSLIRGTSRWCVLDINSKHVRRCAPLFNYEDSVFNPEYAINNGNPQLPDINEIQSDMQWTFAGKVNITDIDRNGHMNNARYADIVVNSCDYEFYCSHKIKAFDFNFLSEMKVNNEFKVNVKTKNNISNFEATNSLMAKPIFRASVIWE